MDESDNQSFLEMISTPPSTTPANKVLHADGVKSFSGSLSFDVPQLAVSLFGTSKLLKRYYTFPVKIYDGETGYDMANCFLTSLTLSGAVGGLLSAQVSFVAKEGKTGGGGSHSFIRDNDLVGYWYTGDNSASIRDWNLSMTQDVVPVYRNKVSAGSAEGPSYIKVGLTAYTLTVTTYSDTAFPIVSIMFGGSTLTIQGKSTANGYSFAGANDLGAYSHRFESNALNVSDDASVIS
jgi:hypothetical protein